MKSVIFSLILINGLFGFAGGKFCSGQDSRSQATPNTTQSESKPDKFALITKSFAPDDGLALTIYITDRKQQCGKISKPRVRIEIWKGIKEVSEKEFTFPNRKIGDMSQEFANNTSKKVKAGSVKFRESNRESEVEFYLTAEFNDGDKIEGTFKVVWCPDPIYPGHPDSRFNTKKFVEISKTCAPHDGAALSIRIADSPLKCGESVNSYLSIAIWTHIAEVSGKEFSFSNGKLGVVQKRLADGKWVSAKSATIRFEKSDDKSDVIFEIDVEFQDDEKVKDKFKAKWCREEFVCG